MILTNLCMLLTHQLYLHVQIFHLFFSLVYSYSISPEWFLNNITIFYLNQGSITIPIHLLCPVKAVCMDDHKSLSPGLFSRDKRQNTLLHHCTELWTWYRWLLYYLWYSIQCWRDILKTVNREKLEYHLYCCMIALTIFSSFLPPFCLLLILFDNDCDYVICYSMDWLCVWY